MENRGIEKIKTVAYGLGLPKVNFRQWKHRGRIPDDWKIKIFTATNGAISLSEMDSIFKEK